MHREYTRRLKISNRQRQKNALACPILGGSENKGSSDVLLHCAVAKNGGLMGGLYYFDGIDVHHVMVA